MTIDQTNSKLVSVICRSIGRAELKQALESIAQQSYSAIEVVLVEALAKPLSDFHAYACEVPIVVVNSGSTLPRSAAANAGLEAATGDYLLLLDDDDWISPDHIQNLVDKISSLPEILAVYSGTQKVSADGLTNKDVFSHEFDRQLLMRDNYIPIHSMLFAKSLVEKGCRFDESFDIFEDWDFWLQLSNFTDFAHVDALTAFYRDGGESETASGAAENRYDPGNVMGKGRAKLFTKWLPLWSGDEFNALIGAMDSSSTLTELHASIETLNTSLHDEQVKTHETKTELLKAKSDLADHKAENSNLRIHLAKANDRAYELTESISHLNQSIKHKENHLAALSRHIDELESALQTIHQSFTWRLMGPVRRIARLLRPNRNNSTPQQTTASNTEQDIDGASNLPDTETVTDTVKFAIDRQARFDDCLYLRGWAVAESGIKSITLTCGNEVIPIPQGVYRDDIASVYPAIDSASTSGFHYFGSIPSNKGLELKIIPNLGEPQQVKLEADTSMKLEELSENNEFIYLDLTEQYKILKRLTPEKTVTKEALENLKTTPLLSIIVPVYNVEERWLDRCIQSVLDQSYPNWQLCLYDDASTSEETLDCLARWEKKDERIFVSYGKENLHISGASNKALEMTKGEFIGLMDNDDELAGDALFWVVKEINDKPEVDYIYTDEDKIDEDGNYCQPHFKPDWSPELLESMMYVGHFGVIRKSVIDSVGGFRQGVEGSQDFDLTLRISAQTQNFSHIAKVLYHWRIIPGSVSGGDDAKSYAYTSAVKALTDYANSNGQSGEVSKTEFTGLYRIQRPNNNPRVAIIMPFHNKALMTIECLQSLEASSYENVEIVAISNNSEQYEYDLVEDYVSKNPKCRLVKHDIPFNWSAINNYGVTLVDADYYLFLNNDMTLISGDWLETLLGCAQKEQVGAVGAKLLYTDDTIQHAGITMQIGGIAGHPFRAVPDESAGYFGYAAVNRNMAAVTGACMLVKKAAFDSMGGFDEELSVAYNDVDFCLRLQEKSYRIVYTPFAKLYHLESKTRPKTVDDMNEFEKKQFEAECAYIMRRHPRYFEEGDPYYNKAFTLKMENYTLRV